MAIPTIRQSNIQPPETVSDMLPLIGGQQPLANMSTDALPTINTPRENEYERESGMLRNIAYPQPKPPAKGFWPKAGHILSTIGNIAGDVLAPNIMREIPGTQLHGEEQQKQAAGQLKDLEAEHRAENQAESESELRGAQERQLEEATREAPGKAASEEALQGAQTKHLENPEATTPEMATYRSLVGMGFSPREALQEIERDKQMGLRPPNMQAKTLQLPTGQQVAGKVDAQGNLLLANGEPAPEGTKLYQQPNYGQMVLPTKTATFIGADGIPREYQWNEATQTYDKPLGMSASNAYGHEAAQAGAVTRAGNDLISSIESNKELMGNPEAIIKSAVLGTPWADPATAGLRAQIATFAALQPSMHGFRGQQAMQQFEKILGGIPNNPDALIAAIKGIEQTAGAINPGLATSNPETREYQGHTYAKGADGQWHLQQKAK